MKLLKAILSFIIISCLASCGGGGGGSSTTSTPTVPTSIPSGAKISINPEIEFASELTVGSSATAIYSNSDATYFPVSADESVMVNMESTSSTITISFKLASGEAIQLIISDLTDFGEDGYYDEYTVDAKVDGTSVLNTRGFFTGTKKPRNLGVSSPVDINRAPTEEEFNKYLVGKVIQTKEDDFVDDDGGYVIYNSDGTVTSYDWDGSLNDDKIRKYEYNYNGGEPIVIYTETRKDNNVTVVTETKATFYNFYEGTYDDLKKTPDDGTDSLDKGTWRVVSKIDQ